MMDPSVREGSISSQDAEPKTTGDWSTCARQSMRGGIADGHRCWVLVALSDHPGVCDSIRHELGRVRARCPARLVASSVGGTSVGGRRYLGRA
jgi:hypothetical protein